MKELRTIVINSNLDIPLTKQLFKTHMKESSASPNLVKDKNTSKKIFLPKSLFFSHHAAALPARMYPNR